MARLRIDIVCDGRAFRDPREGLQPGPEIASVLLRYVQALVGSGRLDHVLRDSGGNQVGAAAFDASE